MNEMLKDYLQAQKQNRFLLKLNLQQHAAGEGEGGEGGEGSQGGEGAAGGEGQGNAGGEGQQGNEGGSGEGEKGAKSKTFTQDDVNAIAAREAKKAQEKLLKQLGVNDFKTAKEGLDKFKEITDAQKTDAQKAAEQAKAFEEQNKQLASTVTTLNAQLAALKADVNPDSLNDVIVLANNLTSDDVTIDDAIQQVLKKYPNFKRAAAANNNNNAGGEKKPPQFTAGKNDPGQKPSEQDAWTNAFNFLGAKK